MAFTIPLSQNPNAVIRISLETVFLALALVAVRMRLWSRKLTRNALLFSDWAIFAAMLLATVNYGDTIADCLLTGNGLSYEDILAHNPPPSAAILRNKLDMVASLLHIWSVSLIKFSILHLYITIFVTRGFRRMCIAVMILQGLFLVGLTVGELTGCRPFAYNFDKTIPGGSCFPVSTGYLILCCSIIAIDLMVLALPIRPIWRLQMLKKRKITISVMFGLGILVTCMTIARVVLVFHIESTWTTFGLFSTMEVYIGIIIATIPTLLPSALRMSEKVKSSRMSDVLLRARASFGALSLRSRTDHRYHGPDASSSNLESGQSVRAQTAYSDGSDSVRKTELTSKDGTVTMTSSSIAHGGDDSAFAEWQQMTVRQDNSTKPSRRYD